MNWLAANLDLVLLAYFGNFTLNFMILWWCSEDEGGLQAYLRKEGWAKFVLQTQLLWEICGLVFIAVIVFLVGMLIVYSLGRKKFFADSDSLRPGEAYRHDPEYPVR